MKCPGCEDAIPDNVDKCPYCGTAIDPEDRVNYLKVLLIVGSITLIFFAVPSIFRTLFSSSGEETAIEGPAVTLDQIKESIGDDQIVKLMDVRLEPSPAEGGQVRLTWRVTVENKSDVPVLFDTDLRFLDQEGAEVRNEYRLETALLGSATETLQGSFVLPPEEADRIKNIRTIVQPSDAVVEEE